jgi:hypothetical protein
MLHDDTFALLKRRIAFAAVVAVASLAIAPPPAAGWDCSPNFLVKRSGRFNNGATIGGSVAANDPGGSIRLSQRVTMADGTAVTGDKVVVGGGASVYDVFANQLLLNSQAVVRNTSGLAALPVVSPFCSVPAIACGGGDVIVPPGQDVGPLSPGTYGRLRVLTGGSVTLAAGAFTFCDIKLGREVTMVTVGPATLDVAGDVKIGDGSTLAPASGTAPVQVNVAGRRVRVSNSATARVAFVAPNAQISFGRDARLAGCFCVDRAKSDKGITLDTTPSTTTTTTSSTTSTTEASSTTTTTTTSTTTSTTLAPVKIAGVRYRSFANTGADEIYLGTGDLGVAGNRTAEQVTWVKPGTYDFTFTYDPGVPELRTTVVGVANPVNETVVHALAAPLAAMDSIEIAVCDRVPGSQVDLLNVVVDGQPVGTFIGNDDPGVCQFPTFSAAGLGVDLNDGFTFTGQLFLDGPFSLSQEFTRAEILVGQNFAP